jgi:UPF0716 protein FxsA
MGYLVFLVFLGVPVLEVLVFISVGGAIGLWPTLVTIIITAVMGTSLLRRQGLAVLLDAQKHLHQGRVPIDEIFDGLFLIFAGALLLTPGFITDGFGLSLFFQPFRHLIKNAVRALLVARGGIHVYTDEKEEGKTDAQENIIDGEFEEVRSDTKSITDQ